MTLYVLTDSDVVMLRKMAARERRLVQAVGRIDPHKQPRKKQTQIVKIGKADDDIAIDTSGTVSVWKRDSTGTLVDTTEDITAHLDWMHGDEKVSSGKEVLCTYFADEAIWRITGAECES